jgi:hypothetical protein
MLLAAFQRQQEKIRQHWFDEIAALSAFQIHLEQLPLPLESISRLMITLAGFQIKRGLVSALCGQCKNFKGPLTKKGSF